MINTEFKFSTARLTLNIITAKDIENVFETMNCAQTAEAVSFLTWPITLEQAQQWCAKSIKGIQGQTEYLFLAKDPANNNVGCLGVHLQGNHDLGEIGYWVTPRFQEDGYATEMAQAGVAFAFNHTNALQLFATAQKGNEGSCRVLEKAGFALTGDKDVILKDGSIRPSSLHTLLKSDWSRKKI